MRVFQSRAGWTGAMLALGALLGLALPAASAEGTGTALGVNPQAQAERAADVLMLTVGANLFIGDRIVTGDVGEVQIEFSEGTRLVVGPNSAMVLEDYLIRNDDTPGKFAINALSGTFRFVTGNAPKDRYVITTPTATMGVRGTAFDFFVEALRTSVLSYHGAVVLCAKGQECVTLQSRCQIGQVQRAGSEVLGVGRDARGIDSEFFREAFRYSTSQRSLKSKFRISNAASCSRRFVGSTVAQSQSPVVGVVPPPGGPPPVDPPPGGPPPVDPPPGGPPPKPDPGPKPPKEKGPHGHPNHDQPKHPNKPHEHGGGGPGKPDKTDGPGKPEKTGKPDKVKKNK